MARCRRNRRSAPAAAPALERCRRAQTASPSRRRSASLGISRASAYEAVRRGDIPAIRIGRRILVPRVALQRFPRVCAAVRRRHQRRLKSPIKYSRACTVRAPVIITSARISASLSGMQEVLGHARGATEDSFESKCCS
ncbi:MAG: helix-turn-helix domain-containing protein [Acidobacteriota bacterium]|nr:helix-turn-helix domain-containing protein [Acidobacteriota bacterium]